MTLLPNLMLDANAPDTLAVLRAGMASQSKSLEFDGSNVQAMQPVSICLLAAAAKELRRTGRSICIKDLGPQWREPLQDVTSEVLLVPDEPPTESDDFGGFTVGRAVHRPNDANSCANMLAENVAWFVPTEDQAVLMNEYGRRIVSAVQPALSYMLGELVDNVFSHARTTEFRETSAWIVAQYYAAGDLVRIAVVDDGCGLLGSMRGVTDSPPRSHFDAAERAFTPFYSSKSAPMIYADRRHMGMGLTVCRDLCQRMEGNIYAISGDAWITNPGTERKKRLRADPFYQGTVISLEFHRRAATPGVVTDLIRSYTGKDDYPVVFDNG